MYFLYFQIPMKYSFQFQCHSHNHSPENPVALFIRLAIQLLLLLAQVVLEQEAYFQKLITATLSWYRRCSHTYFFFESKPLNPAGCSLLSATNARLNKMTRELPNLSPPREHLFSCSTRQSPEAPWWHSATGLLSKRPRHLCTTPQLHLVGEGGRRP